MKIAISGAGIAGPTLAHFLRRGGHTPTLIERAPALRTGGYIVDFWGVGYEVAERMGIIETVRTRGYQVDEVRLVADDGHTAGRLSTDVFHRMTGDRFTSIARADLAETIFDTVREEETLFGEEVAGVVDEGDTVAVRLASGPTRRFDLLVGADGLHSGVRGLVWGEETQFTRPLGCCVAAFEVTGYPQRSENVYLTHAEPGRSLARFSLRGDRTLFLLVFDAALLPGPLPHDLAARKAALRSVFGNCHWEAGAMLEALRDVEELYFDEVSQIVVPEWSRGRTVLVGDALACPSLLAGEGTGLAMTEAYVLAGELAQAGADVAAAFDAYERRLSGFIAGKQKAARTFAPTFFPRTRMAITMRRLATRLLSVPFLADRLLGASVRDDFALPTYRF